MPGVGVRPASSSAPASLSVPRAARSLVLFTGLTLRLDRVAVVGVGNGPRWR